MNFSTRLFFVINKWVGKNPWLDAFGRAGAEWVIIAMVGWYVASSLLAYNLQLRQALAPILFFGTAWAMGWFINVGIGLLVREPRPHVRYPESKLLFTPLMAWKSFPSDHAMSAWLLFFLAMIFNLPFAWSLFPLALWVSAARVYAGLHYPFDVAGGAGVAGVMAIFIYYFVALIP